MAPAEAASPRPKRSAEQVFLRRLQRDDGFLGFARGLGLEEAKAKAVLEPLCRLCWGLAEEALLEDNGGNLLEQVQQLRKQLNACNLAAMRDISNLKACSGDSPDAWLKQVQFHEPLPYLDDETKELVFRLVLQKVSQIQDGTAAPSLVKQLTESVERAQAAAQPPPPEADAAGDAASLAKIRELCAKLEEAEAREQELEARAHAAESRAYAAETERDELQEEVGRLQESVGELQAVVAALEGELQRLRQELEETRARLAEAEERCREADELIARLREIEAQLRASCERLEAENATLRAELESERAANAALREELAQAQGKIGELEGALVELQARHAALEEEAEELRKELERRMNGIDKSTQTQLSGEDIVGLRDENKRLKVMLEELKMKLRDLMEEIQQKGLAPEVSALMESVGLEPLLRAKSVFERLYYDALERISRLEELQGKYQERELQAGKWRLVGLGGDGPGGAGNLGPLGALERSTLVDQLSQLQEARPSAARSPSPASPPAAPPKAVEPAGAGEERRLPQLARTPRKGLTTHRTPRPREPPSDPLVNVRLPNIPSVAWKAAPAYSLVF